MSDVVVSSLIDKLDPHRDYGERTYEEVLSGIRSGAIIIREGNNLPQLVDAATGRAIKGTGVPVNNGENPQRVAMARFRRMAQDDLDEAYAELRAGMKAGDPRCMKIYWELLIGRPGEAKGENSTSIMEKLLEAALENRTAVVEREVIIER